MEFLRVRRTRTKVARLVVTAADLQVSGGLATSLGLALGDHSLRVLYPVSSGRFADSSGRSIEPGRDQVSTVLTRESSAIAVLWHKPGLPGLLDATGAAEEITDTARLAPDQHRDRGHQ